MKHPDSPRRFVRFRKILFPIFFFLFLLSPLTVFASELKNPVDVLLVRGDYKYPPYEFIDENGLPSGYNVDIFNAVADVMGLKADLQLGPWSEVRKALEDGQVDVLVGLF